MTGPFFPFCQNLRLGIVRIDQDVIPGNITDGRLAFAGVDCGAIEEKGPSSQRRAFRSCAPGMARSAMNGADNREAKAEREVTWGCESLGGPECREPLAEQQLRFREEA